MNASANLPDFITDDMHAAAVEVLDAWIGLEDAKAAEPEWAAGWAGTGEQAWQRWNEDEYTPAAARWTRAMTGLQRLMPFGLGHVRGIRQVAADVVAAYAACESCRKRIWSTLVVVDGEPFRVCGSCVMPEAGAVAS